jgi:hypothetical protein
MFIASQRLGNQFSAEINTHSTIEGLSFLCGGAVSSSITIEELLGNGVSVGVAPRLYNKDPRPAEN